MAEAEETFLSHLIELRERLVKSLVAVGIVFLPALYFSSQLYDILALPLIHALPSGSKMIATGVVTPFLIPVKIAGVAALVVVLPYVLYQAWAFVAPGLYMLLRDHDTLDRLRASCRPDFLWEVADETLPLWLLAPLDLQVLKAAGVTFAISMLERVIEERARGNPASAEAIGLFI